MPPTQDPGTTIKVAVCHPGCGAVDDVIPQWFWSDTLEVGVAVPNVRGELVDAAEATLEQLSLEGDPKPAPTDDGQTVQDQQPTPGAVVPVGSSVTLYLTAPAPEPVEVPRVLEETEESARKILEGAGFVPIVVGDAEGTVFRQQPSPGEPRPRAPRSVSGSSRRFRIRRRRSALRRRPRRRPPTGRQP